MIKRFIFSTIKAFKHYKQICALKDNSYASIEQISLEIFEQQSIKVIALDFDGVLSSHGEVQPNEQALNFLSKILPIFDKRIFILSNKPTQARKDFFSQYYPNITFIQAERKKPYPDGLQHILKITEVSPEQLLLIDDRLLTGGLATILAGTKFIYIQRPYVNYKKQFAIEFLFQFFRFSERYLF